MRKKTFYFKVSVSDIDVDFLPIIHEIVKTIEKDPQVGEMDIIHILSSAGR